ncbi:hypothetical protein D918_05338 [Trichuris suis]|nr:hypothetical protein D918_05338 [Trichuris suis]
MDAVMEFCSFICPTVTTACKFRLTAVDIMDKYDDVGFLLHAFSMCRIYLCGNPSGRISSLPSGIISSFGMLTFRGRSLALDARRNSSGKIESSLAYGLNRTGCPKVVRIASLNDFVRYLRLSDSIISDIKMPLRDLFVW